jgi:beta-glucosidase
MNGPCTRPRRPTAASARVVRTPLGEFPAEFVWGVATSAFQIEGAWNTDGKGPSIWDEFCRRSGCIADGSNGDVACDHYHSLEADLDLLADIGVDAYRFSIAWPRVQPVGRGAMNGKGLDFYDRLIDGLLRRGIRPYATLYHWDLPLALQEELGGWHHRDTAYCFAEYAAAMARRYGDRVASFATLNEPWVIAVLGHERGIFAPGLADRGIAAQVSHHLLLGHGLAVAAMQASATTADIGIVLNLSPTHPLTDSPADALKARLEDGLALRLYTDPLFAGRYPADVIEHLGRDAPQVRDGDLEIIARPLDFLGVNYYTRSVASSAAPWSPQEQGLAVTDMGWEIYPAGLTELLLRLNRDYDLPPVYITESGAAFADTVSGDRVEDEDRRAYIAAHIAATAEAIAAGVDVRGYFIWSLLDNFEWASGYLKRFGIVRVDYETLARTPKRSAHWYRDFIAEFCRSWR